jgi:acyl-CoA reductase-like NAD-dependent aldehyde dehydrogenase
MANDTLYGLAAAVFSKDITKAITTANALHAGTVWINSINVVHTNVPFGGYKRTLLLSLFFFCFTSPSNVIIDYFGW